MEIGIEYVNEAPNCIENKLFSIVDIITFRDIIKTNKAWKAIFAVFVKKCGKGWKYAKWGYFTRPLEAKYVIKYMQSWCHFEEENGLYLLKLSKVNFSVKYASHMSSKIWHLRYAQPILSAIFHIKVLFRENTSKLHHSGTSSRPGSVLYMYQVWGYLLKRWLHIMYRKIVAFFSATSV